MQVDVDHRGGMQLDWHPDKGRTLTMPAKDPVGTIVLAGRLRWGRAPSAVLTGTHTDVATHSFFSPNGASLLPFGLLVYGKWSVAWCHCKQCQFEQWSMGDEDCLHGEQHVVHIGTCFACRPLPGDHRA